MAPAWKIIKRLNGKKPAYTVPAIDGPNGVIYTNEGKAEAFAATNHLGYPDTEVLDDLDLNDAPEVPHPLITYSELATILHKLNPHKAPGPDRIVPKALKLLPPQSVITLLHTFNTCFSFNYFPNA